MLGPSSTSVASLCLNQLRRYSDVLAALANATIEHVPNAELSGNLVSRAGA